MALNKGDWDAAEPHLGTAAAIAEEVFGPRDTRRVGSLLMLGRFYMFRKQFALAEDQFQMALDHQSKIYGTNRIEIAGCLLYLGEVNLQQKKADAAEALFARAKKIIEINQGAFHANVALCLNGLAASRLLRKEYKEAEPLFQQALRLAERQARRVVWEAGDPAVYGGGFAIEEGSAKLPLAVAILLNLSTVHAELNRMAEAEADLRKALKLAEEATGPKGRLAFLVLSQLALVSAKNNKPADAGASLDRALAVLAGFPATQQPFLVSNAEAIIEAAKMLGRTADEAKLRKLKSELVP